MHVALFGIYGGFGGGKLANMAGPDVNDRVSVILVSIPKTKT